MYSVERSEKSMEERMSFVARPCGTRSQARVSNSRMWWIE